MKRNTVLTLITIIFFALIVEAQEDSYIPAVVPGKRSNHWYNQGSASGSGYDYCHSKVTCDIIEVNGETYNFVDCGFSSFSCSFDNYVREDIAEQKIYYTTGNSEDEEILLVDFSLEVGDSFPYYGTENFIEIEDVIYVEVDGETRKLLCVFPECIIYFMEGVGHSFHGLGLPNNNGFKNYDGEIMEDCWSVSNDNITTPEDYFSIHPNPSNGEIIIETLNDNSNTENVVEIRSTNGELLDKVRFIGESQTIDTSRFAKGILIVTLISDDLIKTEKIINK